MEAEAGEAPGPVPAPPAIPPREASLRSRQSPPGRRGRLELVPSSTQPGQSRAHDARWPSGRRWAAGRPRPREVQEELLGREEAGSAPGGRRRWAGVDGRACWVLGGDRSRPAAAPGRLVPWLLRAPAAVCGFQASCPRFPSGLSEVDQQPVSRHRPHVEPARWEGRVGWPPFEKDAWFRRLGSLTPSVLTLTDT